MKQNKEKLSKAEYDGYEMQYFYVKQVMTKFDDPKYDDEDKATKADLVETMQKVSSLIHGCSFAEDYAVLLRGLMVDARTRIPAKGDYE